MKKISACLLALLSVSSVLAAKDADKVASLPDCAPLPSSWYSGYLNVTANKLLHYVLVESLDQPDTDPLLVWFNGGPGCSSMLALFAEHGPFIFDDGETIIKPNPEPWNKRANVLYIESPAGVGYSWAGTVNDTNHTDMSQSADLLKAMKEFYASFPEFLDNDLYITGESYAGIYAPYLAWQLHQYNLQAKLDRSNKTTVYPLKGFIVGNGVTNYDLDCDASITETMANFNLIPNQMYQQYKTLGCKYFWRVDKHIVNPAACDTIMDTVNNATNELNEYDLFRKVYPDDALASNIKLKDQSREGEVVIDGEVRKYKRGFTLAEYTPWMKPLLDRKTSHPLLGAGQTDYLNRQDVRTALHILPNVTVFESCSDSISVSYINFVEGSYWIYPILKGYGYKLMHYSGDTDGAVPTIGTRKWIELLQWDITNPWRQWHTDGAFSGNLIDYDNFRFATIHGVGHMAPQWKRKDVTSLITKHIHNEPIN